MEVASLMHDHHDQRIQHKEDSVIMPEHSLQRQRRRKHRSPRPSTLLTLSLLVATTPAAAQSPQDTVLPLRVTNHCKEPIWPAILTQSGAGPAKSGFLLNPGDTSPQTVSGDWRGRVWARTNCSFPTTGSGPASGQGGSPCRTGDCGMFLECQGAVSLCCASM